MSDRYDQELPPLGERTPGRPAGSPPTSPWYRRAPVVGLAGLGVGVALGLGAAAVTDDPADRSRLGGDPSAQTTLGSTTTTVVALPPDCAEAIRSAEQSLTLLDQAFQSARRFDVGELEGMLSDLEQVRRSLTDRVRACLDRG